MSAMASQITSLTIVYSTVYSCANYRQHQSSASLAFVRGIHRWIPRTEDQWRGKGFHLMTSSWHDDMVWPVDSPHEGPGSNAENVFMSQHHHVWLTLVIAMGVQQVYCPIYSSVWFVACIYCLWNYVYRRTRVINGTNNNLNPTPLKHVIDFQNGDGIGLITADCSPVLAQNGLFKRQL